MASRPSIEQAVINNVKIAAAIIRLRHRIEADDELNTAIPAIRSRLEAQAQTGVVSGLSYDELVGLINGKAA